MIVFLLKIRNKIAYQIGQSICYPYWWLNYKIWKWIWGERAYPFNIKNVRNPLYLLRWKYGWRFLDKIKIAHTDEELSQWSKIKELELENNKLFKKIRKYES